MVQGWLAGSQSVIAILATDDDVALFRADTKNLKLVSCFITDGIDIVNT